MCCQGHWGSVPEPEPRVDLSAMELVGYQTSRKEMRDIYHSVYLLRRTPGTPSCGECERRRVIHDILASKGGLNPLHHMSGLVWVRKDLTKWLFGWLTIGHWKPPKPFVVTSKDLKVGEEDHEPIPEARVGVTQGLGLGLTPGLGPGPTLEVDLGTRQGLTVKAAIMMTQEAYVLGPLMDPLLKGE